jgi:mono/diheme cytochrome c family protein
LYKILIFYKKIRADSNGVSYMRYFSTVNSGSHKNPLVMIASGLALTILAFSIFVGKAAAQQSGPDGQALFQAKCAACHTIGKGKLVGPDLKDVTKRRDLSWVKSFITDPNRMFDADPTAKQLLQEYQIKMPTLGLTPDEVTALANYLDHPEGGAPQTAAQPVQPQTADPARGRLLFSSERALANGGPNCIACHTVSGVGALGGGGLGPDLTHVVQRYGEPGLTAALQTISFPTMVGPFKNHPLTPAEQADLIAFFKQADRQPAVANVAAGIVTPNVMVIVAISLGGTLILLGVMLVYWPRQKESLSSRLRSNRTGKIS